MNESPTFIKDTTANPAPLGLLGFGMTTVLLNCHNAGFFELNSMILAMGICYGGAAQVIAGIMEWKKGNSFAATAFTSYGFFWLALVVLVLLPKVIPGGFTPTSEPALATFLLLWGVFTGVMFIGTFKLSRALQFVFGTLTILFFMLAFGDFTDASEGFKHLTGFEGLVCGAAAMYTGLAQILNELYQKTVLPLGAPKPAA
jgi:succinate-acetate transporter protein